MFPFVFPLCVYRLYKLLHPGGAGFLHLIGDVSIDIQGKGSGGVSQILLHRLDIIAGLDAGHGVGVPEVVEPGFGAADLHHNRLKGFIHGGGRQMVPQLIGEHEAAAFVAFAIPEPVLQLPEVDALQGGGDCGRKCQGSALAVLRGDHLILATAAPDQLQLLVNCDGASGEVYAVPQQPQSFALSHSGE